MDQTLIANISAGLQAPLPGREAQYKMAHAVRRQYPPPPENARIACVMPLLYPREDRWHIVLIERMSSNNKNDRHSGQISFPGGKLEPEDASLLAGALREAEEEVGVHSRDIQVLGPLSDLYIPVSNFLVHPFVGKIDYTPEFIPQPTEVKSILEIPFAHLLDPQNVSQGDLRVTPQMILKRVPYFAFEQHMIWGATAMILSELLEVTTRGSDGSH